MMGADPLTVLVGDALTQLRLLPAESVQCCVTSPPYWGLRDYASEGQLGLEKTPEEYVGRMVEIFREVRRVLRNDGTLWLNLGDSYSSGGRGSYDSTLISRTSGVQNNSAGNTRHTPSWAKPKDLIGIPWMVAFALRADGWWLRQDIIWSKPNPMPESVTDRCTKAHEYIFLLTKSARYFYDAEAIKEKGCDEPGTHRGGSTMKMVNGEMAGDRVAWHNHSGGIESLLATGFRNKRSVWTVTTQPYPEAHFATYPPDLIKPCILAGTSARGCCSKCGAPHERLSEFVGPDGRSEIRSQNSKGKESLMGDNMIDHGTRGSFNSGGAVLQRKDAGWQPTCQCAAPIVPCTVLDPFGGSGTTGAVALELGRKATLIELNPKYAELIQQRCSTTMGLPF